MPENSNTVEGVIDGLHKAAIAIIAAQNKITELVETIDRLRRGVSDTDLPTPNRSSQESGS